MRDVADVARACAQIVLYAHYKRLDYFSTECVYAPNAYRGFARTFLKGLERLRPSAIIDTIASGESFVLRESVRVASIGTCVQCGYISSQPRCKACELLEGLNRGLARMSVEMPLAPEMAQRLVRRPRRRDEGSAQPTLRNGPSGRAPPAADLHDAAVHAGAPSGCASRACACRTQPDARSGTGDHEEDGQCTIGGQA